MDKIKLEGPPIDVDGEPFRFSIEDELDKMISENERLGLRVKELEEQLIDERKWFDRKVDLNVKLIKELSEKEEKIKKLEEGIEKDSHWKEDWQKLNKHMEEKLNLLIDKDAKIKELEAELQREEQAHVMSVYDLNIRIAELEEGIKKHRECRTNMPLADEELYKLIKKEGNKVRNPDPVMQGFYADSRIKKLEAHIKELEEGIEGVLNQTHLISFAIQKQLEELIRK